MGRLAPSDKATQELKDVCLIAFNKLGDKATQEIGAKSLSGLVSILNNEAQVDVLLPLLYRTGEEQKPFARKVAVDLLGWLFHESCSTWEIMMQPKQLNRAIQYLKARMMDSDRTADGPCVSTLCIIIERSMHSDLAPWTPEGGNTILRFLFAIMTERQAVQALACRALKQAAEYLSYLPQPMWRELLGHLSNPSYTARASIADCLASCPTSQQVSGLVLMPEESVLPYLPAILGSDASGLIGCLQAADWQVRRSAVCAIKAIILVLGRALSDSDLLRVHQAVLAVKYDVAKNVRASAADCLPVLTQLMGDIVRSDAAGPVATSRRASLTGSHRSDTVLRSSADLTTGSRLQTPRQGMSTMFRQSAAKLDTVLTPKDNSSNSSPPGNLDSENLHDSANLDRPSEALDSHTPKNPPKHAQALQSKARADTATKRKPQRPEATKPSRIKAIRAASEERLPAPFSHVSASSHIADGSSEPRRARKSCGFTIMWDSLPETPLDEEITDPAPREDAAEQPTSAPDREPSPAKHDRPDSARILECLENQLGTQQAHPVGQDEPNEADSPKEEIGSAAQENRKQGPEPEIGRLQYQLFEQQQDQRMKNQDFQRSLEDLGWDMQSAVAFLSARLARLEQHSSLPRLSDEDPIMAVEAVADAAQLPPHTLETATVESS